MSKKINYERLWKRLGQIPGNTQLGKAIIERQNELVNEEIKAGFLDDEKERLKTDAKKWLERWIVDVSVATTIVPCTSESVICTWIKHPQISSRYAGINPEETKSIILEALREYLEDV